LVAALATSCVVTVAGCGGSGATGYHNPRYPFGAPNVPISLSKCMRANGIPNFPDPTFNNGSQSLNLGPGLNPNSPAFRRAAKACGPLIP
jgi:hypothetical protein